jgi:uncharacterized protein
MGEAAPHADARSKPEPAARAKRIAWRPWLRALHRDIGYLLVGLTFIYAASGLAVNHIADWDPNYVEVEKQHAVGPLPDDEDEASRIVLERLAVTEKPTDVFLDDDTGELEITLPNGTLTATVATGAVVETSRKPRPLLRLANWLHLNRGKKAWSYVADSYAVLLLFLATSGLFMLPGRKGLIGRGAIFALLGAAVPALYVIFSGGP